MKWPAQSPETDAHWTNMGNTRHNVTKKTPRTSASNFWNCLQSATSQITKKNLRIILQCKIDTKPSLKPKEAIERESIKPAIQAKGGRYWGLNKCKE